MSQARAKYLEQQIARLEGAIAHLENAGAEIFDNAPPCVFPETEYTRARRQNEGHPPEIYEKSGEDFLAEFRQTLNRYQSELDRIKRASSDWCQTKLSLYQVPQVSSTCPADQKALLDFDKNKTWI